MGLTAILKADIAHQAPLTEFGGRLPVCSSDEQEVKRMMASMLNSPKGGRRILGSKLADACQLRFSPSG